MGRGLCACPDLATPSGTHPTHWLLPESIEPVWLQFPFLATEMRVSVPPHILWKNFPLCCQYQIEDTTPQEGSAAEGIYFEYCGP